MKKIITISLLLLAISSCAASEAPSIRYENISHNAERIKRIDVIWNGRRMLSRSDIPFCSVSSQGYTINNDKDFFGPIHIEWENAKGKKLTKDLVFTKEQLPNMKNRVKVHTYVELYFTQDDVNLYTSDTPNLNQIREDLYKKAGLTCDEYRRREYIKKWGEDW